MWTIGLSQWLIWIQRYSLGTSISLVPNYSSPDSVSVSQHDRSLLSGVSFTSLLPHQGTMGATLYHQWSLFGYSVLCLLSGVYYWQLQYQNLVEKNRTALKPASQNILLWLLCH